RAETPPVGPVTARAEPTTRRGTPWQERSPYDLWPTATATMTAPSQGQHPAHPRHAISTREHQKGGAPTRSAPTRRDHPPRPPPPLQPTHTTPFPPPRPILPPAPGTSREPPPAHAISPRPTLDPPPPSAAHAAGEAG